MSEIFKVWHGGLASHGAAIGIIFALYLYSRKTNMPILWYLDRIVIVVALAGLFIRTGNLINSEIVGKITDLPWGFYFLNNYDPRIAMDPRHPAQLYEAFAYLLIFVCLITYYYRKNAKFIDGTLFAWFLILVFGVRFFIEFVKEPQVEFENHIFLNMGQSLSIPFVIIGIGILFFGYRKHKKSLS